MNKPITSPDDPKLDWFCKQLAELAGGLEVEAHWPREQLRLCAEHGVFGWFVPQEFGGQGWNELDLTRGYLRLSAACLTTTFILTQWSGACRRLVESESFAFKAPLLPQLVRGELFVTLGISHLTTSRRHTGTPAMRAEETPTGYFLNGFSPWVTGAAHADIVVIGAQLEDNRQILIAVPTNLPEVNVPEPQRLVGLTSSHTGELRCDEVEVPREWLLAGPIENVMASKTNVPLAPPVRSDLGDLPAQRNNSTAGLQTSTLAIGLSSTAVALLENESRARVELQPAANELRKEYTALEADLLAMAGGTEVCSNETLRVRANSLVLRSTQAALAAAKGTGYVVGHPAGRWCREALFFLVWSCPAPVLNKNLCELAGLE